MGVTIGSKRHSCDMGNFGFCRFRNTVAEKVNDDFSKHYMKLSDPKVMFLEGEDFRKYFAEYDTKTKEYVNQGIVTIEVANFLYQSDCKGKIDRKQAKQIYELIKDCDDNIIFGYIGKADCAKMKDLKDIFSDGTKVEWC